MIQHLLQRYSIRTRMLGAIAIVLLLLVGVGGTGLFGMWRVEALGDRFANVTFRDATALSGLRAAMGNVRRYEKDMVINLDMPYHELGLGSMHLEETVRITASGCELLTSGRCELRVLPN